MGLLNDDSYLCGNRSLTQRLKPDLQGGANVGQCCVDNAFDGGSLVLDGGELLLPRAGMSGLVASAIDRVGNEGPRVGLAID